MALQTYRRKRRFDVTPEPRGRKGQSGGRQYVIQKHAARSLHYDLRLEMDGVMKSWAVTRGPSLVAGEKRLAVHVEDHPIEYNSFEGTIPQGQYGGGTVMIWDQGHWIPEGDPHQDYAKGRLTFRLEGKKLKGRWHLVRMRKRPGDRQDAWLLIKADDEAARSPQDPDILEEKPRSAASRRTMEGIARAGGPVWRSNRSAAADEPAAGRRAPKTTARAKKRVTSRSKTRAAVAPAALLHGDAPARASRASHVRRAKPSILGARRAALPDFVEPCLAMLHPKPPADSSWIHEIKLDGYRIQARLDHGDVRLMTRKGLDWTAKFPRVAEALAKLAATAALIDGEIVVLNADGISDFSALQAALKNGHADRFVYYVFDLLHLDGLDLTGSSLLDRKAALARVVKESPDGDIVKYSEHFDTQGSVILTHACDMRLEGIVSKRRDAPYRSGRSDNWIKVKCGQNQEFVIAGYEPSEARQRGLRSLVLGYYRDGALHYAGRVGTGFSHASARDVAKRLDALRTDTSPFGRVPDEERRRNVLWARPDLVAEIDFRGWTGGNRIRQGSFKGLREDKPAVEVVREDAMPTSKRKTNGRAGGAPARDRSKPAKPSRRPAGSKPAPAAARNKPAKSAAAPAGAVRFSHPDRIYWTDVEITKQQLADYCTSVWERMAPHVAGRPLALLRCPEGVGNQCFFQKHAAAGLADERIRRIKDSKGEELIYIEDLDGLLTLVQAGVLEIHVWGSTVDAIERCNRIVLDLDPGDDVPWSAVIAAARELRQRLAALRLESFVKTSGGKGLHVVLPIDGADWAAAKDFAHALTLATAADSPDRYVAKMTKSIRHGRIFIDYLRNGRGATAVAAYSTRARAGAPVSTPVSWDELGPNLTPTKFTLLNIKARLARQRQDPWADMARVRQQLPDLSRAKARG